MSTSDVVFIVGEEASNFKELWENFTKTYAISGGESPLVQSFRFGFERSDANTVSLQKNLKKLAQEGWLFKGSPDSEFKAQLLREIENLSAHKIPFRLTPDRFSQRRFVEIVCESKNPYISITFEDKVENTLRFMKCFVGAFSVALGTSTKKVLSQFEKFHDHCQEHLKTQTPFEFQLRAPWFRFTSPLPSYTMTPRMGRVGRHEIFEKLEIFSTDNEIKGLLELFIELSKIDRHEPPDLYLQYFLPPNSRYRSAISDAFLLEKTYDFEGLTMGDLEGFANTLALKPPSDLFAVLAQSDTKIDENPSVLYTLRKVLDRGFELRANLIWDMPPNKDPEIMIEPIEASTGLSWNRIV
ncbi:MAG: hypothetical protein KDD48_07245 [Bdellovibrionales bacterium]|nr:hypothetical protein [Bdellovibrionales bacterium]